MVKTCKSSAEMQSLVLRVIYALCLLGATWNHWTAIYLHGIFWDYGGLPKASTTFWTLLALLDPTAVILLFWRPNAGVAATAAIIVTDVIHNAWITARYFPPLLHWSAGRWQIIAQIIFMVFVVVTASSAWMRKGRGTKRARP
jgi:hypothetical protein